MLKLTVIKNINAKGMIAKIQNTIMGLSLSKVVEGQIRNNFKLQQNSDGSKWQPVSMKTYLFKKKYFSGTENKTLIRTYALLNSISCAITKSGGKITASVSYNDYGRLHQNGSGQRIPKREFVYLNNKSKMTINDFIRGKLRWVMKLFLIWEMRLLRL